MFARHPLSSGSLDERGLVDALRLAIIAELDAISFYEQVARAAPSEEARRLFADVAREERTHVGEFLSLLLRLDPGQAEELRRGFEEARELLGPGAVSQPLPGEGAGSGDQPDPPSGGDGVVGGVEALFREALAGSRVLASVLPVTRVGEGVDFVTAVVPSRETGYVGVEAERIVPLEEYSVEFLVPERVMARARRLGGAPYAPVVVSAARRLAMDEERAMLNALLSSEEATQSRLGPWERPGEAVEDVARAVAALEAEGARGPFVLLVSPRRYARLLVVHERTGVMELSRVERLARVVRHPLLGDERALLLSAEPSLVDIVVGVEARVEYLGQESGGAHRFRGWETMAIRVQEPAAGVAVLAPTA